jgi:hypothetical protein
VALTKRRPCAQEFSRLAPGKRRPSARENSIVSRKNQLHCSREVSRVALKKRKTSLEKSRWRTSRNVVPALEKFEGGTEEMASLSSRIIDGAPKKRRPSPREVTKVDLKKLIPSPREELRVAPRNLGSCPPKESRWHQKNRVPVLEKSRGCTQEKALLSSRRINVGIQNKHH